MVGLNSFVVVTEPLGALGEAILPGGESAADSRFVVRYWRKTPDGRLVFGGGESNAGRIPADVRSFVRPHLLEVYPQLARAEIEHGWGGVVSVGELGPLTDVVNNAAGNFLCPSEDLSPGGFDAVIKIVLYGTFHVTQAVGRRWIERGPREHERGYTVLSIVTTYAWMGSAFVLPSACAKAGVLALTRSLATEWASYGIRLNAIAPGPVPTEGAYSRLAIPGSEALGEHRIPLGRYGRPPELADLAVYLTCAGYVTGECVTIDGGEWLKVGQEFAAITDSPRDQVKQVFEAIRAQTHAKSEKI
jgi:NAD(P)-dependent dehydrogenase (short-subunit alcohol dehydrogenase family)